MGIMGEEKNSDNMVAMVYDRRLNGELQESIGGVTEWQKGYQNLRSVNYFLEYYKVPAKATANKYIFFIIILYLKSKIKS